MARSLDCGLHQGGEWQEVLIADFTREVDGKNSLLRTSPGRWMARSLNCGLHQGDGWQEVLILDFTREVDGKKS